MYPSEDIPMADSILMEFDDIANNLGITHFLWHGTCLGLVRDGTYPESDIDIDVGVICTEEKLESLFQVLVDHGFEERRCLLNRNRNFLKDDMQLDIYFVFSPKYDYVLQEFSSITYNDRTYSIPHPIEEYFTLQYGKSWQTPQDWIWMNGWRK